MSKPSLSTEPLPRLIPTRTMLRFPAAMSLVATAAVHLPLIPQHLHEAPYVGWLFIGLAVVTTALAVLMMVRDSTALWLAAGGTSAAAMIGYLLSRSVGLPQIGDDIGNWTEPLGVAAICAEGLTVFLAVLVLRHRATTPRSGA